MNKTDVFFEKVRRGYLDLAGREPERFVVLDAMKSPDQIAQEIWHSLEE